MSTDRKRLFNPRESKIKISPWNRYYDTLYLNTNDSELNTEFIGGTYEYLQRREIYID